MSEELITEEKPSEEQTLLDLQMLYNNIDPLTGKKKRGRKPKALKEQELKAGIVYEPKPINSVPKKRGRKPKGGKIIEMKNKIPGPTIKIDQKWKGLISICS